MRKKKIKEVVLRKNDAPVGSEALDALVLLGSLMKVVCQKE